MSPFDNIIENGVQFVPVAPVLSLILNILFPLIKTLPSYPSFVLNAPVNNPLLGAVNDVEPAVIFV